MPSIWPRRPATAEDTRLGFGFVGGLMARIVLGDGDGGQQALGHMHRVVDVAAGQSARAAAAGQRQAAGQYQ